MKKLIYAIAGIAILMGSYGCKEGKPQNAVVEDSVEFLTDTIEAEPDTTIYGRCGEGTTMHMLELLTNEGDTLTLAIPDDSITHVKGGLSVGDRLAVITEAGDAESEAYATNVINLTTLLGKWAALDKTFELQEGGTVVSDVQEPRPITEWKIFNGRFVLSIDTFDIYELGADSLYLENERGIFVYKRVK